MADSNSTIRAVAWREVCPWLVILRSFGRSIGLANLCLATIAVLLLPLGWQLADLMFLGSPIEEKVTPQLALTEDLYDREANIWDWPGRATQFRYTLPTSFSELLQGARLRAEATFARMVHGWRYFIHLPTTVRKFAFLIFGGLWTLLVWAIFGGAITRMAVVQLGRDEKVPLRSAVTHAIRRLRSYIGAPLLPIFGIVVGLSLLSLLGILMWSNVGVLIVGLLWPLVLLGGLTLAILLVGTCFGWPLMWVALGAEQDADAFEATSRGFTYAFQRPLRYVFYAVLAALIGGAGWLLVFHMTEILLAFCRNTVLWAAGAERAPDLEPYFYAIASKDPEPGFMLHSGGWLIRLSNGLVRSIATAYGYSYFFCAASAIYLLLRRDIDETEMDEVYGEDDDEPLQLPPLAKDVPAPTTPAPASAPPPATPPTP